MKGEKVYTNKAVFGMHDRVTAKVLHETNRLSEQAANGTDRVLKLIQTASRGKI